MVVIAFFELKDGQIFYRINPNRSSFPDWKNHIQKNWIEDKKEDKITASDMITTFYKQDIRNWWVEEWPN